jgi:hypothetical protein
MDKRFAARQTNAPDPTLGGCIHNPDDFIH